MSHPVHLDVSSPARFDRIQLLLRFAITIAMGWIGATAGWVTCALFLGLPIYAAVLVSTRGPQAYVTEHGPRLWRVLHWLLAFSAYMLLLTDRFPVNEPADVHTDLAYTGQPTTSSALLRLILSIPSAFVLALLGFVSFILYLVGAVTILAHETVPPSVLAFQRGILRWQARLLAYHASLVDEYPPFSFDDLAQPGAHSDDRTRMV
ncbi:MAG TPA: DUF4389 domain-containing protein [Kofleriaceae bacterium]|nr:DUF4389 domain-containing protein [Kofleriaceae bacterium]